MPSLATQRYRELLSRLAEEEGRVHGWKKAVAERLGVTPSYVSKLVADPALEVGRDAIERARERLGLTDSFFFDSQRSDLGIPAEMEQPAPEWLEAQQQAEQGVVDRVNIVNRSRMTALLQLSRTPFDVSRAELGALRSQIESALDTFAINVPEAAEYFEARHQFGSAVGTDEDARNRLTRVLHHLRSANELALRRDYEVRTALDATRRLAFKSGWESSNARQRKKKRD